MQHEVSMHLHLFFFQLPQNHCEPKRKPDSQQVPILLSQIQDFLRAAGVFFTFSRKHFYFNNSANDSPAITSNDVVSPAIISVVVMDMFLFNQIKS